MKMMIVSGLQIPVSNRVPYRTTLLMVILNLVILVIVRVLIFSDSGLMHSDSIDLGCIESLNLRLNVCGNVVSLSDAF